MKSFLLFIVSVSLITTVFGQWNADPTVNTLVVGSAAKGTTSVSSIVSATDGAGGMFIVWTDTRNTATTGADLFFTRLKADGTIAAGFDPGGNIVCNAAGSQSNPAIVADGTGKAIIVWQDGRDNASQGDNIYAVRVKGDGTLDGPANGFLIAGSTFSENSPAVTLTTANRAAIVWRFTGLTTSVDLSMNFADFSTNTLVFPSSIVISDKTGSQSNHQVTDDGNGGAIVIWTDARVATTNIQLYGQRVNAAGTLLWGPAGTEVDGLPIITTLGNVLLPAVVSDGSGGAVVAFGSTRAATDNANIYAQRIDATGNMVWTAGGVNVCVATTNQTNARIVISGTNYIVAWADRRESTNPPSNSNNIDIFIQSLNPADGSINWTGDGVQVIKQPNAQPNSQTDGFELLEDGSGGAFVAWDDARISTSDLDVFAQHVKNDGSFMWPANGAPVSTKSGFNQSWPKAVLSNDGKLMVAFRDSRTATTAEIYASLIEPDGILPVNFLEVSATAQAKQVLVKWTTAREKKLSAYEVERSANGVEFVTAGNVNARNSQGIQQYGFTDFTPSSGNNYYRIKSINLDGTFKFSAIVKVSLTYLSDEKIQLYPNPAVAGIQLQLNGLPAGNYQVRIVDASGRNLESLRLQKGAESQVFGLQVGKLAQGIYRVQVMNEKGEIVSVKALLKK